MNTKKRLDAMRLIATAKNVIVVTDKGGFTHVETPTTVDEAISYSLQRQTVVSIRDELTRRLRVMDGKLTKAFTAKERKGNSKKIKVTKG